MQQRGSPNAGDGQSQRWVPNAGKASENPVGCTDTDRLALRRPCAQCLKTRGQFRRDSAANACEEEEAAQYDRNGVDWMTEEQHEALDGGDLDKEESEADRQKVEADSPFCETGRSRFSAVAERQQGCKDQDQSECPRLGERCHQHEIAPIEQRYAAKRASLQKLRQRPPFEEIEKVRPVVGRRCDVKLVITKELIAFWPK